MHASPHQIQVQLPHNIEFEQALLGASLCRSIPHATARTWRAIIEAYPGAVLLGLTATPSHRAEQDPHLPRPEHSFAGFRDQPLPDTED